MILQRRRVKSPLAIESIDDRYCRRARDAVARRMPPAASAEISKPVAALGPIEVARANARRRPKKMKRTRQGHCSRIIAELTAHRTLALRDALAENPAVTFQPVLHNFVLLRIPPQQEAVPVAGGAGRNCGPRGLQGGMDRTIGKTNSGLVPVSRPKELISLKGSAT